MLPNPYESSTSYLPLLVVNEAKHKILIPKATPRRRHTSNILLVVAQKDYILNSLITCITINDNNIHNIFTYVTQTIM